MKIRLIELQLAALSSVFIFSPLSAQEVRADGEPAVTADATAPRASWVERDTLTGDWAGRRTWLKEHGITFAPRLTQFYQGLAAGDGDRDFEYGGKADLMLNADLSKLGFWKGFALTVHGEYNLGESINWPGGVLEPPNTAVRRL